MSRANRGLQLFTNPMHLSESNEAYTPRDVVEASRATLGAIDLDPASCALANTVVRASSFFSFHDDGLNRPWRGRTFCNPPGGKSEGESLTKLWWKHGSEEWWLGRTTAIIWIAFKVDFDQTTQVRRKGEQRGLLPLDFPRCIPSRRLAFLTPDLPGPTPKNPTRKPTAKQLADHAATGLCTGESPPHASSIIFLPGRDVAADVARFKAAFGAIGEVIFDGERLPARPQTTTSTTMPSRGTP